MTDRPRYFDLDDNCIETGKMGSRKLGNRKIRFFRGLFRFRYFRQFCVALFLTISIFVAQFSRCPIFCCPFSRCRFFLLPFFPLPLFHTLFFVALFSYPLIFRCRFFQLPNFPVALFSVSVFTFYR